MYLSPETIENVGKSLVTDMLLLRNVCINFWNWVTHKFTIFDTKYDTKKYDDAICEVSLLESSHEKIE